MFNLCSTKINCIFELEDLKFSSPNTQGSWSPAKELFSGEVKETFTNNTTLIQVTAWCRQAVIWTPLLTQVYDMVQDGVTLSQ